MKLKLMFLWQSGVNKFLFIIRGIFAKVMTMEKKQILAKVIGI